MCDAVRDRRGYDRFGICITFGIILIRQRRFNGILANSKEVTKMEGELAELEGLDVSVTIALNSAGNLGPYSIWLLNQVSNGKKCSTPGDTSGNVLINDEYHLVYDTLGLTLGDIRHLGVAVLFLIAEKLVDCEGFNFKLLGSKLGLIKPINTEVLPSGNFTLDVLCSGVPGIPAEKKYWNDAGNVTLAVEIVNVSGLRAETCDQWPLLSLTPSVMVEIMG